LKSWLFTILRNLRLNQLRGGLSKSYVVEMDEAGGRTREFEDKSSKDRKRQSNGIWCGGHFRW